MTLIRFSPSSLREGRWYEYLIRFALGGAVTVFTGLISSRYGPSVGGLFLALPAIFCASATLIEKHEIRRKREAGFVGERRGQEAAALDAAGAALGALGMLAFAIVFSLMVESSILVAFIGASLAWLVVSVAAWYVRRKMRSVRKARTRKKTAAPRFREAATVDRRMASGRGRSLRVDALAQRHRVELGVRRLFLVQVGRQETHDLVVTEFFGPCDQRPITAHFVVLDSLRICDDGGVQHGLVLDLAGRLVGLFDDAVDRRTLGPAGLFAELFEDLLKSLDLLVGFFEMALQPGDQIAVGRFFDHLGQRFDDLLLGVVDVLKTMKQQILHGFDVLGEKSHFEALLLQ